MHGGRLQYCTSCIGNASAILQCQCQCRDAEVLTMHCLRRLPRLPELRAYPSTPIERLATFFHGQEGQPG